MQAADARLVSPPARDARARGSSARLRAAKALFLVAAGVSFLFSVYLWFLVDREQGLFVGLWVPSILGLGAFLLAGEDRHPRG